MSLSSPQPDWELLSAMLARIGGRAPSASEVSEVLWVVLELCEAASADHSRCSRYEALEPGQVMLCARRRTVMLHGRAGTVRAAADADSKSTLTDSRCAERVPAAYMAPEQAWGRSADFDVRTDVYCIGGVLHAILAGRPPHDGGSTAADLELARAGALGIASRAQPEHPLIAALWLVARRALSANPTQRHPTAMILRADVSRAFARYGGSA